MSYSHSWWKGKRVRAPHNIVGTVVLVLDGLDEAADYALLGPLSAYARETDDDAPPFQAVTNWLDKQEHVPRTPRKGIWLHVNCDDGGSIIVGSLDVEVLDEI